MTFFGKGCLLMSLLLVRVLVADPAAPSDDWPRYAHDKTLTSRSPLKGKIAKPRTAWSYSMGGQELELEIIPTQGKHDLKLHGTNLDSARSSKTITLDGPILADLDGTGTLRPALETYHERWAKVLPEVRGWQRVNWSHVWTDAKVCRLQLHAYDQGFNKPRLVWETDPPEPTMFQPLNLIYDLDRDGVPEVCVAAHYRVMIFDAITGRKETELRYHQSRPYGWFGLADVDADGQMELVTIGDFQSHLDVLNYDPKKPETERLSVRWRRDIEQNIEERKKWPQVGPRPLVDVTGDGRPEMLINLFNDNGDGEWHAMVLNAATGEIVHDFAKRFIQGTGDLTMDGRSALFLMTTEGVLVPTFGLIELVKFHQGKPNVMWNAANASWGMANLPRMEATWSTTAAQGLQHVVLAGNSNSTAWPLFFVAQRTPTVQWPFPTVLQALSLGADQRIETAWQVSGLVGHLEFEAVSSESKGAALRMQLAPDLIANLSGQNAETHLVGSKPLRSSIAAPIAARLEPQGAMIVLAEAPGQQIVAIQPPPHCIR